MVEIRKGQYNGQKLIKLVSSNTKANINNTIDNAPEIIVVKNKTAITMARIILTNLSVVPIFFFIFLFLSKLIITNTRRSVK